MEHHVQSDKAGRTTALRHFVQHLIEMLAAMMAGMLLLAPVWTALRPNLSENAAADAMVMAVNMAIGMALWMWMRGHDWQLVAEMATAMVAPFALLLIPYGLGSLSGGSLMLLGHVGMVIAMLGAMLVRLDAYTHTHGWRLPVRLRA
jgi:flagellar biosynthetic protein FliP